MDVIFLNYFQESLLEDVICENISPGSSESIISTFIVSRYLTEPPSVLKILFQIGTYDMTTFKAIQNELKVDIPLEFLYTQPSSNENISCTLVSLINHNGDLLDCGNSINDIFDASTSIWWHCDDDNITQISDLPKVVYVIEIYQKIPSDKIQIYLFSRIHNNVQNQQHEESN